MAFIGSRADRNLSRTGQSRRDFDNINFCCSFETANTCLPSEKGFVRVSREFLPPIYNKKAEGKNSACFRRFSLVPLHLGSNSKRLVPCGLQLSCGTARCVWAWV